MGQRKAYAHTPNGGGDWHLLVDHLAGTARRAAEFAEAFGAADLARAAGWLHDAGKCSCAFSAYLRACATDGDANAKRSFPKRDHKTAGAVRAASLDRINGPLLATTIFGHHGGMPDLDEVLSRLVLAVDDPAVEEALSEFDVLVGAAPFTLAPVGPAWASGRPANRDEQRVIVRDIEMLWRLVFSALVDADYLDTEAHFAPMASQWRAGDRGVTGLRERFETRRRRSADTTVNRARSEMYDAVLASAELPTDLYKLAAPTGSGKTQMGLGWALAHAEAHGLRRIVTAVPFITVTDQVAEVYRDLLDAGGDQVVVEHHSQVTDDDGWRKLATESWDAPVIVTTTIRLFESLFSNSTSACRRLHRLAKSVIVLDEAQAIPVEVLEPVVDALRALVDRFGATVLIMTATQPTLENIRPARDHAPVDLLPDLAHWSAVFHRTETRLAGQLDHAAVAGMVNRYRQCLCVVNTIADAREITAATLDPGVLHLSTMLRPADRRDRIKEIGERLAGGEECRVVSTQLVEAGVDLDFPVVLRAMAPLPSLAQADGRCNRNGALASGLGQTIVFDLVGGKNPPGAYYTHGTVHTVLLRSRLEEDLASPALISDWYRSFLNDRAVRHDTREVQRSRDRLQYKTTAERFRMIDDDTISVAVPWPRPDARAAVVARVLSRLRDHDHVPRGDVRHLQEVTVSLRHRLADRALRDRSAEPVTDYLLEWTGDYDRQIGLVFCGVPTGEVIM